jgi:FAD/FMN-containing dehydrogenase/Fe-S oxidoreductase
MVSNRPIPPSSHAKPVDTFAEAAELEHELRQTVAGEVRFDRGSRALYSTDASNYRQIPIGVVVPRDKDDVLATLAACRKYGAPVLSRGAGTSLAGQCCNVAVVLDFTKNLDRILDLDVEGKTARVQPGVVLDTLRDRAEENHLTFAPDPSTHNRCTVGGMIGNNSCGTHSLMGGKTVDNVEELEILLYDGTSLTVGATSELELARIVKNGGRSGAIFGALKAIRDQYGDLVRARFPRIPRRVSGYNLDELLPEQGFHVARSLVGSEGTCAVVVEAKVKLIASPQQRVLVGLGYRDAFEAADQVPEILNFSPIAVEGMEGSIIDALRQKGVAHLDLLPEGNGLLLVEFGSSDANEALNTANKLIAKIAGHPGGPRVRLYDETEVKHVWHIRESGPRAAAFAPGAPPQFEGWDDSAVSPENLGRYLRELRRLLDHYGYRGAFYGHFGHACIHMRVSFDLETEPGIRKYGEFIEQAADLVVRYGGSISGEHGDGQSRGALLPKMFGPELMTAFAQFKSAWDPKNKLNPNKLIQASPPTENLRLGPDYKRYDPKTHFSFPEDNGSFNKAALRCIGLGACRKSAGTMCPSYMITKDEEHSTRGRAHLLFEMLQGEVVGPSWSDEHVKHSLDLCLSCKACKTECPANVDMATYKAEFLSHYHDERGWPLNAYLFGLIDRWASIGSLSANAANALLNLPGLEPLVRKLFSIPAKRKLPRLAPHTFREWGRLRRAATIDNRENVSAGKPEVLLWVDTFTNYFQPQIARAAYRVLEESGFTVLTTRRHLCCGRPLYDFGMLKRAKSYLYRILSTLAEEITRGTPVVVLEPSCASVFRDELRNLFPQDALATRLSEQVFLLTEFLGRYAPQFAPQLPAKILLHGHCHQKALLNFHSEVDLLRRMGADVEVLDSGCCGMAGSFGFREDSYVVSQALAERVLLPKIRSASSETLIVTDGFSCREQISQSSDRVALHIAQILQMAVDAGEERTGPTYR